MRQYFLVTIVVLVLFLISLTILFPEDKASEICFDDDCFEVEVAKTSEEHSRGLMFRESLGSDNAMLFIFSGEGQQLFWMKDMLIPLDIVWLNQDLEVVYILQDVLPCEEDPCPVYGPSEPALYVVELSAGTASRINLELFDRLTFGRDFRY
jgi:uncharacterized protein